jgi:hypothetical protein
LILYGNSLTDLDTETETSTLDNGEQLIIIDQAQLQLQVSAQSNTPLEEGKTRYATARLIELVTELDLAIPRLQLLQGAPSLNNMKLSVGALKQLQRWWKSPSSELLWIQEPASLTSQSSTSTAVLGLAQRVHIPTIFYSFSGDLGTGSAIPDFSALNKMIMSMIVQILQYLPDVFYSSADFSTSRFGNLDGSPGAIEEGLDIFLDLLKASKGPLIVIVNRLDLLDRSVDPHIQSGLKKFLTILQLPEDSHGDDRRLLKSLLITPAQTRFLVAEVKLQNRCEDLRSNVRKEGLLPSMFAADMLSFEQR